MKTLIQNVQVVNEGKIIARDVLIQDEKIWDILPPNSFNPGWVNIVVDGTGKYLIPGCIDDQVHFREPGLTHKADIASEAKAAIAGGITSFMEMPNTVPNTVNLDELAKKFDRAQQVSLANFSFYLGATHDNIDQIKAMDVKNTCGIKIFMGSSTGNMLVDDESSLNEIFKHAKIDASGDVRRVTPNFLREFLSINTPSFGTMRPAIDLPPKPSPWRKNMMHDYMFYTSVPPKKLTYLTTPCHLQKNTSPRKLVCIIYGFLIKIIHS